MAVGKTLASFQSRRKIAFFPSTNCRALFRSWSLLNLMTEARAAQLCPFSPVLFHAGSVSAPNFSSFLHLQRTDVELGISSLTKFYLTRCLSINLQAQY